MINMPAGPEIMVILLLALLVLGPDQLPKAMRSFGNVMSEIRKVSSSFQAEMRDALEVMEDGIVPTVGSEAKAESTDASGDAGSEVERPADATPSDGAVAAGSDRAGAGANDEPESRTWGSAARRNDGTKQENSDSDRDSSGDPDTGAPDPGGRAVIDPADRAAG